MGKHNVSERVSGKAKQLAGSAKKNVGRLVGDEQMEAEGAVEETQGRLRQAAAKVGAWFKGLFKR